VDLLFILSGSEQSRTAVQIGYWPPAHSQV